MRNNLRELRERHGLTQAELARAMDITRQTVISIERRRYDPQLELAFKLAAFFECTVDDIFDPEDLDLDETVRDFDTE